MKRYHAIKCVSEEILNDGLVNALFLKGSIARNEDDEYSDVDMYAVVSSNNRDSFLNRRIQYLEKYMPLVFWTEANFVGPQIVGVYEDLLHFDLYTVAVDSIPQTDDIKIIYDKDDLLKSYQKKSLSISPVAIINEINEFSFTLLEFESAYSRKDYMWAIRLFHAELHRASIFSRFIYDRDSSMLGLKRLYKVVPDELYIEYRDILEDATPSNILIAMKKLIILVNKVIHMLPKELQEQMNTKFYNMMLNKINTLN